MTGAMHHDLPPWADSSSSLRGTVQSVLHGTLRAVRTTGNSTQYVNDLSTLDHVSTAQSGRIMPLRMVCGGFRSLRPDLTALRADWKKLERATVVENMPAITVPDVLTLPVFHPPAAAHRARRVRHVATARTQLEGGGFQVRRTFPGLVDVAETDPFLLLDHLGAVEYAPFEAVGAPDHPHRGFETVTYILDGELEHRDSHGGGGVIAGGDTQWMTAGSGLVHSEMPTERIFRTGGLFHGFQLWVNLPAAEKWVAPRYQDLAGGLLTLVRSADGGALVRIIAGALGGHDGPGLTQTPIVYAHATLSPGARLDVPGAPTSTPSSTCSPGRAPSGPTAVPVREGQLAVLGDGDAVTVTANAALPSQTPTLEVLLIGGRPIREPVVQYGPFVMNTKAEIVEAIDDFQAGRMGRIPAATSTATTRGRGSGHRLDG